MSQRLDLITCASFAREIQAVQSSPDLAEIRIVPISTSCDLTAAGWPGLGEVVASRAQGAGAVGLLGGYCLSRPCRELGLDGECRLFQESQCYEWLADKSVVDQALQGGALPVLPGWLEDWEAHVDARWGSDRKAAQSFYRDVARKIVLVDTGVHPGIDRHLRAFGRFLRLPFEVLPAGLEHFSLALSRIALGWRAERLEKENARRSSLVRGEGVDNARIGRLVDAVAGSKTMDEAQAHVLDLFRALLAPRDAVYHSLESLAGRPLAEGSPLDRIVALNADQAWSDDGGQAFLKIAGGREIFGVLELAGLDEALMDGRGTALALTAAKLAGVALSNVRSGLALEAANERAETAEAALASGEEMMARTFHYPLGTYRTTPQGKIIDAAPQLARMLGYPDVAALKAVNFWDLHKDPRDRDNKQAYLDSTSMVGLFECQLKRANGTTVWGEDSCRAAKDAHGRILYYDGVIEDIGEKKRMKEEHAWVTHLEAAVVQVSERLLSSTPIEEISSLVLDQARRLTSSPSGFVGPIDQKTGALIPAALTDDAAEMMEAHSEAAGRFHEGSGLWRWVLEEQRAIVTSMPSLDPRYRGLPDWHLPVGPFLAVPAIMAGAVVGLVAVANGENPYLERDLKAVERLAQLYALAVQRTRTETALHELSLVDDLTKVYNRRGFWTLAEQQVKVAHRSRKEMTLFYADLDDLKRINDTFGHEAGDQALIEAADMLREAFRDSDIIARIGGDEFVILAIDIAEGRAAGLARRLEERLQARNARPGRTFALTFSVGTCRYDPDRPASLQELLTQADRKMYQAKTSKKGEAARA
ncbi:MAG TPA: diguanylate cyclase [Candidatus Aminicenantes bacterium]|nr:diguanylate cyclase [Candidatus Aminicenantes bacterium]HRY66057.1 diguanylate cyclase [Candidatus Aminicenantes bacterium]HRZ72894.1 diguanylate cyclase [Candidatus Aminicenantes bacterium]